MEQKVSVLVTGDFYGGNGVENFIAKGNFVDLFADFLPIIQSHDVAITNLESAITDAKVSIQKTGPAIKSSPLTAKFLKDTGFSLVTLANNHIMDFGVEGLADTIAYCQKNGITNVGAGMNQTKASETYYIEKNNIKIAVINIAENEWSTTNSEKPGAHALNPVQNYYKITEARKNADFVLMIVHGGHEMYHLPSPRMKSTFRFFIDAGADIVVNHHTHCYSGYEFHNGKPIFYSTGNFLFNKPGMKNPLWNSGYAVSINFFKNQIQFEIIPYLQCADKIGIRKLSNAESISFYTRLKEINKIIKDNKILQQEFDALQLKSVKTYRNFIEPHNNKWLYALQKKGVFPSLLHKRKKLMLLNLVRCESHRDVLISVLMQNSKL